MNVDPVIDEERNIVLMIRLLVLSGSMLTHLVANLLGLPGHLDELESV